MEKNKETMSKYKYWEKQEEDYLLMAIEEGKSIKDIAEKLERGEVSVGAKVKRVKKEAGINQDYNFWKNDDITLLIQYYKEDKRLIDIAKLLNRSLHSVSGKTTFLINTGEIEKRIGKPYQNKIPIKNKNLMIKLLKEGKRNNEIKKATGISLSSIKAYATKLGLTQQERGRWTDQDLEKLREMMGEYPFKFLVQQFNKWATIHGRPKRTERAIRDKITEDKCSVRCIGSDQWLDAESIAAIFNVGRQTVNSWIKTYKTELCPKEDGFRRESENHIRLLVHRKRLATWIDNHRLILEKCHVDILAIWSLARD